MAQAIRYNVMILLLMVAAVLAGYMAIQPKVVVDRNHTQTIKVTAGDTLWTIAEKVATPEVDIREVIYVMKDMNKLSSSDIKPGVTLQIPTVRTTKPFAENLVFSIR